MTHALETEHVACARLLIDAAFWEDLELDELLALMPVSDRGPLGTVSYLLSYYTPDEDLSPDDYTRADLSLMQVLADAGLVTLQRDLDEYDRTTRIRYSICWPVF